VVRRAPPPAALPLFALAAALLGTSLPLLAHAAIPADALAGARLARLYVSNIAGCAAGGLLTGFALLHALPLRHVNAALFGATFLLALPLSFRAGRPFPLLALLPLPLLALAPALHAGLWEKLLWKRAYAPGARFAHVIENRSGVITVDRDGVVYGGGLYDGRFHVDAGSDANGITRAYAVAALHPAPRDVLVVGLGSGAWAQVLAHHPTVERVTIVEINPGYVELLALAPEVASLRANPRVRIVIDDGRRWLHANSDRFDLVVQNTTYHFRAHCTNLVSREYFELARAHLREGGVLYLNTTGSDDIYKTACAVFPHARRFRNFVAASDAPIVVPAERVRELIAAWTVDGAHRVPPDRVEEIAGGGDWEERAAIVARTRGATVVTDDNMAVEW